MHIFCLSCNLFALFLLSWRWVLFICLVSWLVGLVCLKEKYFTRARRSAVQKSELCWVGSSLCNNFLQAPRAITHLVTSWKGFLCSVYFIAWRAEEYFFLLKASPPMHSAECCFCPRETNKKNKSQATDVHIYSLTLALACKCLKFQPGIGTQFLSLGACSVCIPCASVAPCPLTASTTQTRAWSPAALGEGKRSQEIYYLSLLIHFGFCYITREIHMGLHYWCFRKEG